MHCTKAQAYIHYITIPPPPTSFAPCTPPPPFTLAICAGRDFLADGSPLLSGRYLLLSSLHTPCTLSFMCTRYMERYLPECDPHVCPGIGDLYLPPRRALPPVIFASSLRRVKHLCRASTAMRERSNALVFPVRGRAYV